MQIRPPHPHSRLKYYFNDVVVLCIRNGARGCLRNVDKTVTQRDGDRPFAKREAVPAQRGKPAAYLSHRCGSLLLDESDGSGKTEREILANLQITKNNNKKTASGNSQRSTSEIKTNSTDSLHIWCISLKPFT